MFLWLESLFNKPEQPSAGEQVEVQVNNLDAYLGEKLEGYVGVSSIDGVVTQSIEAEIHTHSFVIAPDDVYIINNSSNIPPWLQSLLDNAINNSDVASSLSEITSRFDAFETGVTNQIGYLENADQSLAYDLSTLYVTHTGYNAGIQQLSTTFANDYVAKAGLNTLIASWVNSPSGGASWWEQKIQTTADLLHATATSTASLSASINSEKSRLDAAFGDIESLSKQVDGVVETWFDLHDVATPANGNIILTAEPYATWLAEDTRSIHTGDTYVKYEINPETGQKDYIGSWRFTRTSPDEPYTDADGYAFVKVVDSVADDAYQAALLAQATADSKILTFYQASTNPPADADLGDLWYQSDNNNKLYRYDGTEPYDVNGWVAVDDKRIQASVDILSEATVNVDGTAHALYSVKVDANGNVSGVTMGANDQTSNFTVYADRFKVVNYAGQLIGAPFEIDTTTNQIYFNGRVQFNSVDGTDGVATKDDLDGTNGTVINGGAIQTNTINANKISSHTIWTDGRIKSSDFTNLGGAGFRLKADADATYDDPTIYGAYIRGGTIYGSTIASPNFLWYNNYGKLTNNAISLNLEIGSISYALGTANNASALDLPPAISHTVNVYPQNSTVSTGDRFGDLYDITVYLNGTFRLEAGSFNAGAHGVVIYIYDGSTKVYASTAPCTSDATSYGPDNLFTYYDVTFRFATLKFTSDYVFQNKLTVKFRLFNYGVPNSGFSSNVNLSADIYVKNHNT